MDKYLYPTHPVLCFFPGPYECGNNHFLTNIISNFLTRYDKVYIYSPSLHPDLYKKLNNCFSNYIPIFIIPNTLNEEDFYVVIDELVSSKDFEKSDTKTETYEPKEKLNFPQEHEDGGIIILDDLN